MSPDNKSPEKKEQSGENFFQKILSIILGSSDPEKEKKKLLKQIDKNLRKQRVKFYNWKHHTVLPALAKLFYEYYKILGPAQNLVRIGEDSKSIKIYIIDMSLTDKQIEIKENLTEKAIRERLKQIGDPKKLMQQIREELKNFLAYFDLNKINEINETYNNLAILLDLINYDYYFILKKFDSGLPENDFVYKPHFEEIDAEYVSDDIKDFLDIILSIDPTSNSWPEVLKILNTFRNTEIIPEAGWKKIIQYTRQLQKNHVLEMLVQLIDKDPFYKPSPIIYREKIVEGYLDKLKAQTEVTIQRIIHEKRTSKINELTQILFGSSSVVRLKNYSETANISFSKKLLGGYSHIAPLNYLKAFLLDYLKKDIRELADLLLVRGKWSTNQVSQQLSEAYHQLLKISDEISQFDESLDEDGNLGKKLKSLLIKSNRDKGAINQLRLALKEVNDTAKALIVKASQNLIVLGKTIKLALEDREKEHPDLIINWKEIESYSERDIKEFLVDIYKKIYYFLQLLKLYQ